LGQKYNTSNDNDDNDNSKHGPIQLASKIGRFY